MIFTPLLQYYRILYLYIYLPLPENFVFLYGSCYCLVSFHFNLKDIFQQFLLRQVLVWRTPSALFTWVFYFSFILLPSGPCNVSAEKSPVNLMGPSCTWWGAFVLRLFKFFVSRKFDYNRLSVSLLVFILVGVLLTFWIWMPISFLRLVSLWPLYLQISSLSHSATLFLLGFP